MERKCTVIIPAYNEEKTIAKVVKLVKKNSSDIVDQIIVVDNASTDNTGIKADVAGATVIRCKNKGKGYAMEDGLIYAKNDVIAFLDADIDNYSKDLIHTLVNPIFNKRADFVKSMFEREGGRVTELVAKPLLEIKFPNMYKFSQPLSGMIAGRKEFFQKIQLEKGYGVDIGILLDMIKIGARVEEVSIGKINNNSKQLLMLRDMAKQVMITILDRASKN